MEGKVIYLTNVDRRFFMSNAYKLLSGTRKLETVHVMKGQIYSTCSYLVKHLTAYFEYHFK